MKVAGNIIKVVDLESQKVIAESEVIKEEFLIRQILDTYKGLDKADCTHIQFVDNSGRKVIFNKYTLSRCYLICEPESSDDSPESSVPSG